MGDEDEGVQQDEQPFVEQGKRDKMYEDLYHKVMKSKNPKDNTHRVGGQSVNTFQVFKEGWSSMQDKINKDY